MVICFDSFPTYMTQTILGQDNGQSRAGGLTSRVARMDRDKLAHDSVVVANE